MNAVFRTPAEVYNNAAEYDSSFVGSGEGEAQFYIEEIQHGSVLYLGSGSGRLLKDFLAVNPSITGVELSDDMLRASRELLPTAKLIQGDALTLELPERFNTVIAPFRFLCHFANEQLEALFERVSHHLLPGGKFVGDLMTPYHPLDRSIRGEIQSIELVNDMLEKVYNTYEHDKQLCYEWIEKVDTKSGRYTVMKMTLHYYYPEQLASLAKRHGFSNFTFYGDYHRRPMSKETTELVFVLSK